MIRARGAVWTTVGTLAIAAGVAGCVHDDSSIFIKQVMDPPLVSPGQQCIFKPDPSETAITSGELDISIASGYTAVYLVGNQLVSQANSNQLQTETSNVDLEGAEVRVTEGSGEEINSFTTLGGGTIFAASGGTPSWGLFNVQSINQQTIAASTGPTGLSALQGLYYSGEIVVHRVVTYVKIYGKTLGGRYVESNEFEFPVDVCYGCLVGFSSTDQNVCYKEPNCFYAATVTSTSTPCFPGQDGTIDCSDCQGIDTCTPALVSTGECTDAGVGGG
jgi:hypothetical protein